MMTEAPAAYLPLPEIEARLADVSPGPWTVVPRQDKVGHWYEINGPRGIVRGRFLREADADFAAHARTDVAELLSRIDWLDTALQAAATRALAGRCRSE